MKRINWEDIKGFYKEKFGIDGWLVELFANEDILLLCASGADNKTISTFTELPIEEIDEIILSTFKFEGWSFNLDINPYRYYTKVVLEKEEVRMSKFIADLKKESHMDIDYKQAYFVCKTMWEIESKINDEWN